MDKPDSDPPSRKERIAMIRRQIAAGAYETSDKLEAAVAKMARQWIEPPRRRDTE